MRTLAAAGMTLPPVVALLRLGGYRRVVALAERVTPARAGDAGAAAVEERIARTVRMVAIAARRLPVPSTCLSRSLTIWWLLRRGGVHTEVVIGVRPGGEPLDAHAWVEHHGVPVNESPAVVASYLVLRHPESA